jgi:hypothetical protein
MKTDTRIEILEAMRQGTDYRFEVLIRGQSFRLRPLCNAETIQVADSVQEIMMNLKPHQRHALTEHTLVARKTLEMASTPGYGTNNPTLTDYVLERFTNDELHMLYQEYASGCDKVNPKLEEIPEAQVNALVEEVKKNSEPAALGLALIELSSLQLVNVCRRLILDASQTAK